MSTTTIIVDAATADPASSKPTGPPLGSIASAGAGITGGYTGDSLSLQCIIATLLGLSLYNGIELIVLIFVTFQRYRGLYFWSLFIAGLGIFPYSLGFVIKFFQLLDPNKDICFVAVVMLSVGWYLMITGQFRSLFAFMHPL